VKTIVPDATAQVGCVVERTVGTVGAEGTALMVTVEAVLVKQELLTVLLTLKVLTPAARPENVADV
jgi:hypothetical protein